MGLSGPRRSIATTYANRGLHGFQPIIKLTVEDLFGFGEEGEVEVKMDQTLSDLAFFLREDGEDMRWISWGTLVELWFTTVDGTPIPMNVTVAKLIQDGLISDGAKLLLETPQPKTPSLMNNDVCSGPWPPAPGKKWARWQPKQRMSFCWAEAAELKSIELICWSLLAFDFLEPCWLGCIL
jgi:hypothetical protein